MQMGIDDKIKNAAEDAAGRAKEGLGAATDNDDLEREGKMDRADSAVRTAGENVKDAVKNAADKLD
jgi:uncharacterized protein YjbJ (UPF0337 family)